MKKHKPTLQFDELESRVLFSDDTQGLLGAALASKADDAHEWVLDAETINEVVNQQQEIYVINNDIEDRDKLISDIQANHSDTNFEIYILDSTKDGLAQIDEILNQHTAIDSLHILSHGNNEGVKIGATWLNQNNINQYSDLLSSWQSEFKSNGDILFYGCNLAATSEGQALLENIQILTETDIAASTDITGSTLNGDWALEHQLGQVEATALTVTNWQGDLLLSNNSGSGLSGILNLLGLFNSNDRPTASNSTVNTNEDTAYTFSLSDFNYNDADNDPLTLIKIVSLESVGSLEFNGEPVILNQIINSGDISAGNLKFVPAPNGNGNGYDNFSFKVHDGEDYSTLSYTMTIDVTATNDLPTAANNTLSSAADTNYVYTLADFNFSDIDGNSLVQIQITNLESIGDLKLNGVDVTLNQVISAADITGGNLTFTPQLNQAGAGYDSFDFKVHDGTAYSTDSYTITHNINHSNALPIINNDTVITNLNQDTTFNVFSNDTDPDSDNFTILEYTDPANGSIVYNGAGNFTYTPDNNYTGNDNFDYIVSDSSSGLTNYWRLDGDANDLIGSANGSVIGATTVPGNYNDALSFDQVDDYATLTDVAYNNEFTLSFKFKVDDISGSLFQYIYSHGDAASMTNSINIYLGESDSAFGGMLRTQLGDINDLSANEEDNRTNTDINALVGDGQWHTYTLTVESGIGARVYIDGELKNTNSNVGGDPINPTGDVVLGGNHALDSDRFFSGSIDSVALYSRPLSSVEITDQHTHASTTATVNIEVDNLPIITITSADLNYTENQGALAIDPFLQISDSDDTYLDGASIIISNNYVNGEDVLDFTNQLGINGSWDGSTGTLILSGNTSVNNYEAALRTVTYTNLSENPSTLNRTVSFSVENNNGTNTAISTVDSRDIVVNSVNDLPLAISQVTNYSDIDNHVISLNDIGYHDIDSGSDFQVQILGISGDGELTLHGTPVTNGEWVNSTDIANGALSYQINPELLTNTQTINFIVNDGQNNSQNDYNFVINIISPAHASQNGRPSDYDKDDDEEKETFHAIHNAIKTKQAKIEDDSNSKTAYSSFINTNNPYNINANQMDIGFVNRGVLDINEFPEKQEANKKSHSAKLLKEKNLALAFSIDQKLFDLNLGDNNSELNKDNNRYTVTINGMKITFAGISFIATGWVIRSGALAAAFMGSMPIMRGFDPLPLVKMSRETSKSKHQNDKTESIFNK